MHGLGDAIGSFFAFIFMIGLIYGFFYLIIVAPIKMRKESKRRIPLITDKANEKAQELLPLIRQNFLVKPCFHCHEFTMRLLDISPNVCGHAIGDHLWPRKRDPPG